MRTFYIVPLMAVLSAFAATGPSLEKQAQFFAGVFLLESKGDLRVEEKAVQFRTLEAITGITAGEACDLLTRYRDNPAHWRRLYEMVTRLMNAVPGAAPKPSGPGAAAVPPAQSKRR